MPGIARWDAPALEDFLISLANFPPKKTSVHGSLGALLIHVRLVLRPKHPLRNRRKTRSAKTESMRRLSWTPTGRKKSDELVLLPGRKAFSVSGALSFQPSGVLMGNVEGLSTGATGNEADLPTAVPYNVERTTSRIGIGHFEQGLTPVPRRCTPRRR